MKLQIVLVLLLLMLCPLSVMSQAFSPTEPKSGIIVYSKGKMYVAPRDRNDGTAYKGDESECTSMFIDGSAIFTTGAAIEQHGRTELTGDFVNGKNPTPPAGVENAPNLFTGTQSGDLDGVIAFVGTNEGTLAAGSNTRQWIYGKDSDWTTIGTWDLQDQKATNWINFPTLLVQKGIPAINDDWTNVGVVTLDPSAAVSVDYLGVDYFNRNRLEVKTAYRTQAMLPAKEFIESAYLKINKYSGNLDGTNNALGRAVYSQVDFKLYKYEGDSKGQDDGWFDTSSGSVDPIPDLDTYKGTLRDRNGWNYLVGFAPPFKQLGADYMFYHVLTQPDKTSLTSGLGSIVDPYYRMKAGRGYFISMEVSHADHEGNIDLNWDFEGDFDPSMSVIGEGIHSSRRARGGYLFNRMLFHDFYATPSYYSTPGLQLGVSTDFTNNTTAVSKMDNMSRFVYDASLFQSDKITPQNPTWDVYDQSLMTAKRPIGGYHIAGTPLPPHLASLMDRGFDGVVRDRSRYELMDEETFVVDDVQVELESGLNFLGNPFMAPISLNPLLGLKFDGTAEAISASDLENGFAIANNYLGSGIIASTRKNGVDVRAKYWVINQGLIRYLDGQNLFEYKVTYDYIARIGGQTVPNPDPDGLTGTNNSTIDGRYYHISPMQMFCLQAGKPTTITLTKDLIQMGKSSIPKSETDNSNEIMKDWFVVEAYDKENNQADRTSVAFTDLAIGFTDENYNTLKGLDGNLEDTETIKSLNGDETATREVVASGIVYTKSSKKEALLGHTVPLKTKEMALYFKSPENTQETTLRFYGIENMESIPGVWLVDRLLNKVVKVDSDTEYTFVSSAASDTKSLKSLGGDDNRFILRFYDDNGNGDDDGSLQEDITCYYKNSALHVLGLNDGDMNSDLMIYDMQGRLMGKTKINAIPMMYPKPLTLGTYIAKIVGKRNHTAKFVNLKQ